MNNTSSIRYSTSILLESMILPRPPSYHKYLANSALMFAQVTMSGVEVQKTFKPLAKN